MKLDSVLQVLAAGAVLFFFAGQGAGCGGNVVTGGSGGSGGTTSTSTLNACEQAVADLTAKIESCGGTVTGTATGTAECTPSDGQLAKCIVACYVVTSCDCIGYGDTNNCTSEESSTYADCVNACQ